MRPVGFSSNTMPSATARELVDVLGAWQGDCLDLRAGRSQVWERSGLEVFDEAHVSFLGTSTVLGAGVRPRRPGGVLLAALERSVPVRIFVAAEAPRHVVRADLRRLRSAWGPDAILAAEPHASRAGAPVLEWALDGLGLKLVADVLGLARQFGRDRALALTRDHAIAVQVKGFSANRSRHVPIASAPAAAAWAREVLESAPCSPATVETNAASLLDDLRWIQALEARP